MALSLEDVLKLPEDMNEDHLRSIGLLPPQPSAVPPSIGSPPAAPVGPVSVAKMTPPIVPPHAPAAAPAPPEVAPLTPPANADLGVKPMTLPKLNYQERQALPSTSAGVAPGSPAFYEGRIERAEDQKQNPWGSAENHPGLLGKIGHVAGRIGNIALDVAAPATAALIPGTDINRNMREAEAEEGLAGAKKEETQEKVEQTREKHEENLEDTNQKKIDQAQEKIDEQQRKDLSQREVNLRKQGLKLNPDDPNGVPVPLAYDDMSPQEQAVHDLKVAQADSLTAKAALDKVRADPNSPQNQAILERVKVMAMNAKTAARKLGLDERKFLADYFGTDENGDPLPGVQIDPKTGKPIGPKVNKATVNADAYAPGIQKSVVQAAATQDAVRRLMKVLEPQKDDNQPFGSFMKQVEYRLGKAQADEIGQELASINLSSLQQGGQVIQQLGGTRSIQALKIALQHTPDPTKDSVKLMYQKMQTIDRSLATFLQDADKYGRKKATAIEPERMVPAGETPPAAANAGAGEELKPPKPADPGMKWQHRTVDGKVEWRQVKGQP